jgi:Holliday junction resolvase RusA-like endonuclease
MYRGGRRFLTKDGKYAKQAIGAEITVAKRQIKRIRGAVALNVLFYFPDKRKRDIDNCLKALLDCCTGILYDDDSQITTLHVYKFIDRINPRTIIKIEEDNEVEEN